MPLICPPCASSTCGVIDDTGATSALFASADDGSPNELVPGCAGQPAMANKTLNTNDFLCRPIFIVRLLGSARWVRSTKVSASRRKPATWPYSELETPGLVTETTG